MGEIGELIDRICDLEHRILSKRKKHQDSMLMSTTLSMQQIRILYLLEDGEMSINELAAELGVTSPTMTGIVDRLFNKGFVDREIHPVDRRRRSITLTATGQQCVSELNQSNLALFRQGLESLPEKDLDSFAGILQKMVTTLGSGELSVRSG